MAKGRIESENGVFYLRWEGGRDELPGDLLESQPGLKELIGQDVEVLLSEPRSFVIGLRVPKRPPILCYLPAPPWISLGRPEQLAQAFNAHLHPSCYVPADWMIRGVEEQVRRNLADRLLKDKVISKSVHDTIVKS